MNVSSPTVAYILHTFSSNKEFAALWLQTEPAWDGAALKNLDESLINALIDCAGNR